MIPGAEEYLLLAVRDTLRTALGLGTVECEVDFDEEAPAIAGEHYMVVMPGGCGPDPRHKSSGGVNGMVFSVAVAVVKRLGRVPRDRRQSVFLTNLRSINADLGGVYSAIDWQYAVINTANQNIANETGIQNAFVHPLVFQSVEPKPRLVGGDFFGANAMDAVGMIRTITFTGALAMTSKT